MRCQGWRWAVLACLSCVAADTALGQQPPRSSGPTIVASARTTRGKAGRVNEGTSRLPPTVVAPAPAATEPAASTPPHNASPAGYEWSDGAPRTSSKEVPPVDFVNTAAARREAELEARLAAVETALADEKKKSETLGPPWYEVGSDLKMSATWKDGLELSTKNKDFRVHVGGRTQLDASAFSVDPNIYNGAFSPPTVNGPAANPPSPAQLRDNGIGNQYGNGLDFRRARLRIDGTMYEQIEWAVEYDFVNSANVNGVTRAVTAPTDLWWTFTKLPWLQNVRIGNQKPAKGFEHLVSSRFQPFMERSYNQDAFYGGLFNGFIPGIAAYGVYGEEDIGTWNVGLYKPTNNVFAYNTGNYDYQVTARMTRLLQWDADGRYLWHIGGSVEQASTVSHNVGGGAVNNLGYEQYRTRDAIRGGLSGNWPTPASIILAGSDHQRVNLELVGVHGPWTFQSEYLVNVLHNAQFVPFANGVGTSATVAAAVPGGPIGPVQPTAVYHGGYAQVLYFLTGEHDHYNKKTGFFERVRPYENFFCADTCRGCCSGWGAWQIGARYNYLCLNDGFLNGGILHDVTAGLNWFLNPNMKLQFNYMCTYRDAPIAPYAGNANPGDGFIHGFGMRVAHDF